MEIDKTTLADLVIFDKEDEFSVFNKIILWLNYITIVSLLIAVAAKYIPPILVWLPAFFGLAFPYIFLLNILFIIYWFIQFKHAFIFGFIVPPQ